MVAEHRSSFGRGEIAYEPWHYVPILERKPGALRNGAPFKDWKLPDALGRLRTRLAGHDDGDRQFVRILAAVQEDGLEAVEAACAEALDCGACSADVVLNILARQRGEKLGGEFSHLVAMPNLFRSNETFNALNRIWGK